MLIKNKIMMYTFTGLIGLGLSVGGATFALFTSSATNDGNSATAGTVNINVMRDNGDPVPGPMFYPDSLDPLAYHPYDAQDKKPSGESIGGWAPGDTVVRDMFLGNSGSLTARLVGIRAKMRESYTQTTTTNGNTATNTINNGVTSTSNNAAYTEFVDKMNIRITNAETVLFDGKLSELITGDKWKKPMEELLIAGSPSGPLNLKFRAELSKTAGNIVAGKNFIFDFEFTAVQDKHSAGFDVNNQ
ncbi:hypothetical protein [Bacillus sp. V5-8f]|uniref:hypothetical protein n=1 Tax=Bacillus sp. V5-8f TaxID=2053044 RepID=UPI000C758BC6|nr:hypothetical protein [Bacillus sp. V5-8f]PLT35578.1 hypothetical protein CUU64_02945 [Bacillus sp. V5-8f]